MAELTEEKFNEARDKAELINSEIYTEIRKNQLDMIVGFAKSDYDEKELKGMLKLIAKTDEWSTDFKKMQVARKK